MPAGQLNPDTVSSLADRLLERLNIIEERLCRAVDVLGVPAVPVPNESGRVGGPPESPNALRTLRMASAKADASLDLAERLLSNI